MTEKQAIEYFHSLPRTQGQPTLARMRALLAALGNPEKALSCVHIAGTNGKGTVASLTAAILQKAGYKTGLTISPYVLDFCERFQINGEEISPETLGALAEEVRTAADTLPEPPVEFEAVTALALLWFAREECELVVLETGLGGRFDATNAVENTLVAAITRIGLDHTELLGSTVEEIAAEKCGILKPGCVAVCYPGQPKAALQEIIVAAGKLECELVVPEPEDLRLLRGLPFENRIDYGGYEAALAFPGTHQAANAAMAVEIALALWRKGYHIDDDHILAGLQAARLPARIEVLRQKPLLLLDGCHNPDGAAALADTLQAAGCEKLTAVMGFLADKDVEGILQALEPCFERVFAVAPGCPRALDAKTLAQKAERHFAQVTACASLEAALQQACVGSSGLVVCGSLYLAAEARPKLLALCGRG